MKHRAYIKSFLFSL